jgi:hypothetical protein
MGGDNVLRENDNLQTNLYGTVRLCPGDIAQLIDRCRGYAIGACTLGDFLLYKQ